MGRLSRLMLCSLLLTFFIAALMPVTQGITTTTEPSTTEPPTTEPPTTEPPTTEPPTTEPPTTTTNPEPTTSTNTAATPTTTTTTAATPEVCPPGYVIDQTITTTLGKCRLLAPGYYNPNTDSTSCQRCPFTETTEGTGSTSVADCVPFLSVVRGLTSFRVVIRLLFLSFDSSLNTVNTPNSGCVYGSYIYQVLEQILQPFQSFRSVQIRAYGQGSLLVFFDVNMDSQSDVTPQELVDTINDNASEFTSFPGGENFVISVEDTEVIEVVNNPGLCANEPCKNFGKCTDIDDQNFECECVCGFTGDTCEEDGCQNGGTCTEIGEDDFKCECPCGFKGKRCQKEKKGKHDCDSSSESEPSSSTDSEPSSSTENSSSGGSKSHSGSKGGKGGKGN